ncbi:glycosyltransferase family 2 protein [Halarcobacter ebronensis]|uniref:glycosyltransferase family 2 protein n=1 Tax=Halarcobacter ebronensis TaxID=1462615 RepID=UPI0013E935DE|nr:glycosyltransferase family 2 protein [Halarcobacter ebronensis]QKF81097.1 glycosyltransferase, family 2 [Halarcobacter ebronensis]
MNSDSKVSILIPTRNRTDLFKSSLESILNQTYKNIEIIISDNYPDSIDTEEYIKNIKDKRIIYIKQKELIPMEDHWNFLIKQATGEYICIYHDDDIYSKDIVETSLKYFLEKDNVLMCHVLTKHFSNDINQGSKVKILHTKDYISNIEYLQYCIKNKPSIVCSSVMYPRWVFNKYKFKNEYKSFDYHLWFELLQNKGYIAYNTDSLMYYRKHANNTFKKFDIFNVQKEYCEMFEKCLSDENRKLLSYPTNYIQNYIIENLISQELGIKRMLNPYYTIRFYKKLISYKFEVSITHFFKVLFQRFKKRC